jgi:uncharacterized LabA/DUF88 family protein
MQSIPNRKELNGNRKAVGSPDENGKFLDVTLNSAQFDIAPYLQRQPLNQNQDDFEDKVQQRVAIFIDGSNLFYAALHLNIEIDYAKLLCKLTQGRRLLRAYFYTGVDRTNDKQQGFLLWMRRNGYRVVAKELIQHTDGSKKANLDVEIAVDMMMLSKYCGTVVLLSGDGDLAYAVNSIAYRGVQIEIVSLPSMTSDLLINVADRYIDLATIREDIQKTW